MQGFSWTQLSSASQQTVLATGPTPHPFPQKTTRFSWIYDQGLYLSLHLTKGFCDFWKSEKSPEHSTDELGESL